MNTLEGASAPEVVQLSYGHYDGQAYTVPLAMCSTFNGVSGWHKLSDEERAHHGWYPARLINSAYDSVTQVREVADCKLLEGVIYVTFEVRNKTKEGLVSVQTCLLNSYVSRRFSQWPSYKDVTATPETVSKLPLKLLSIGVIEHADWLIGAGRWVTLDIGDVEMLIMLNGLHTQACFTSKRLVEESLQTTGDPMSYPVQEKFEEFYSSMMERL